MSRQANGSYLQPANTAAVSGTTIGSAAFNTLITDIGTEITNSLDRGGRSAMTAALPMGANKITGLADPTLAQDAATKNYVDSAAAFTTGDLKPTLKNVADTGWILGGSSNTIGNTGSGATVTGATVQALYTLIWTNIANATANAYCPVTGGLGVSAAADWSGLKKMETGWYSGRALGFAGAGGALTTRTLGSYVGAETATLGAANIPSITSYNAAQSISVSSTVAGIPYNMAASASGGATQNSPYWAGALSVGAISSTGSNSISTTYTNASPTAVPLMQPTFFANVMIKL